MDDDHRHVPVGRPLWSLTEDVRIDDRGPDGRLVVRTSRRTVVLAADAMVDECLYRMTLGPVALENVAELAEPYRQWKSGHQGGCYPAWRRLSRVFDQLSGCVIPSLALDTDTAIVSLVPLRPVERFGLPAVPVGASVRLRAGTTVLGNGTARMVGRTARYRAHLAGPAVGLVRELAMEPTPVGVLGRRVGMPVESVTDVLAYLAGAGLVDVVD